MNQAAARRPLDSTDLLSAIGRKVEIATPEGVILDFRIATMGQRGLAFALDLFLVVVTIFVLLVGLVSVFDAVGVALGLVLWFVIVNFYFPFCEYRWGATLGKRLAGIRVIDRRGAPLSLEAILARNLMRDLEFWFPFAIYNFRDELLGTLPAWAAPLSFFWVLAMIGLPLFNRRRLRLGDYVGGTIVVRAPRPQLLKDLAQVRGPETAAISFTPAQLAIYGRVELQVLEDLLRRPQRETQGITARVAAKVKKRIGWSDEGRMIDDRRFLEAFYRAQRAELERLLVLGRARESKEDAQAPR